MEKDTEIGFRIYNLRLIKGYTREEMAYLADISTKFLYEIETGRKGFSIHTLIKLSDVLEIACDYILTGDVRYIEPERLKCIYEISNITSNSKRKKNMEADIYIKHKTI